MYSYDPAEVRISVLDLAPVVEGHTPADAFRQTLELAQQAEQWGYHRFWLAEHHNMPGIASSATSVVIGYVAAGTERIRVGSGGIMLPNHAPLVIAEQFGTLESMYPGRIDLGLGRAPGSDQLTARALRRGPGSSGQDFPQLLEELRDFLKGPSEEDDIMQSMTVRAIPGEGLQIPIWLLGSSGFSAQLAAQQGLPFAFASHFAPDYLLPALELYREQFRPSEHLQQPHVMVGINVIAADSDEEAHRLATSQEQAFLSLIRRETGKLKPPVDNMDTLWNEQEKHIVKQQLSFSLIGSKQTVQQQYAAILESTRANEIIVTSQIYAHEARLRSYELFAEIAGGRAQL